ncbi:MAG: hypothetical protein BWZ07_00083 [Alphaproteobacteria bacterium ADurb.BinA280]|mgnify:CR=1 FL=1|jgi:hypothetical protein|nr:hypothetical protein [Xanthomonadales bacterium]MCC6505644.1 hypothetical protein [Aquimonas sp.]OPZ14078.1 MAG: hypothetical protein BWZ07_00083 [Alphaproteobacteria bacterium ADurb.BinA280]
MRTRHRGRFAFIIVAMLMAGGVIARDYDKQAAEAAGAQMDAVTVFVDADWGGREDGAAREITRAHKAFQMRGYRLLGVETYTENGDLEGFFVSYVRGER